MFIDIRDNDLLNNAEVEVCATQEIIPFVIYDLHLPLLYMHQCDVKCATTQVIHQPVAFFIILWLAAVEVGQACGYRLL
ncbi:hypothetical protein D3C80_1111830 [compost metagenome]